MIHRVKIITLTNKTYWFTNIGSSGQPCCRCISLHSCKLLQLHLSNSKHVFEAMGVVSHTGIHESPFMVKPNLQGMVSSDWVSDCWSTNDNGV